MQGLWSCDRSSKEDSIIISDNDVTKTYSTRLENYKEKSQENTVNLALTIISQFLSDLIEKLKLYVFDGEDLEVIKRIRIITDIKSIHSRLIRRGSALIDALEGSDFVKTIKIQARSLRDIDNDELRKQYNLFLQNLEKLHVTENMDSKDIIKMFLNSKAKLYEGFQMILYAIISSCISFGIESTAESAISTYNLLNSSLRVLKDETCENEMFICINGPNLSESDSVLRHAIIEYFKKNKVIRDAHFTTSITGKRKFLISKVLSRHKNLKSKLPFMV